MEVVEACTKKKIHSTSSRTITCPCNVKCTKKYVQPMRVQSFVPTPTNVFPYGAEFMGKTIYKESYIPCNTEQVSPIVPCGSISKSTGKMSGDTTSKLSYQAVQIERRAPIIPRIRNIMQGGSMQCETTSRRDFAYKVTGRPELAVPCGNIRTPESPLDNETTTRLSYANPGPVDPVETFKPILHYCKPTIKLEAETISKLSYRGWETRAKEKIPWACKGRYEPPKDRMVGDTVYHMSYPTPGHYVEEYTSTECPCHKVEKVKN